MHWSGIHLFKLSGSSASDLGKCRRDSAAQKKEVQLEILCYRSKCEK